MPCRGRLLVVQVALECYAGALACSTPYDTRAVLRLVQLWLAHSTDSDVCRSIHAALKVLVCFCCHTRVSGLATSVHLFAFYTVSVAVVQSVRIHGSRRVTCSKLSERERDRERYKKRGGGLAGCAQLQAAAAGIPDGVEAG